MADVMAHNLATAHRPQPVLALAGAITLQAVLAGRKVRDERGNRTNLYAVGVAPSGAGKDHARKVSKNVLFHAGLDALEANEDLASDAGLVSALEINQASLFQFDEFGRFLRTIGDAKKAPHLYNVLTALMKLYSSADTVFKGKAYADAKRNKVIDRPCAVVYGTTVPEHFFESLTADALADGFDDACRFHAHHEGEFLTGICPGAHSSLGEVDARGMHAHAQLPATGDGQWHFAPLHGFRAAEFGDVPAVRFHQRRERNAVMAAWYSVTNAAVRGSACICCHQRVNRLWPA